jgi:hypothetical protein
MNEDRRREIGLFRYALVRDAADPVLSKAERGRLIRALAEREHLGPDGRLVRIARGTLDRWVRDYRRGGFEALVPRPRVVAPRTPAEEPRGGDHEGQDRINANNTARAALSASLGPWSPSPLKRERPERTAARRHQK